MGPARTLVLGLAFAMSAVTVLAADDLLPTAAAATPESLLAEIPHIDTEAPGCPPFTLTGTINLTNAPVEVSATYSEAGETRWRIADGKDDTPFMASAGRQVALYDPVRPVLLFTQDAAVLFELKGKDRHVSFSFNIKGDANASPRIHFDMRSLMDNPSSTLELTELTDRQFTLASISPKKNRMVVTVQRGEGVRPAEISLTDEFGTAVFTARLTPGPPDKTETWKFPNAETLKARLPLHQADGDVGMWAKVEAAGLLLRALYAHAAIRVPEFRDKVPVPGFTTINWTEVETNHAKYAPALRELFSPPSKTRQPGEEHASQE